jgi:uncharacterized phage-associated protein
MASVYDVAQYILDRRGEMTTMKLQKLVYYCQAWHIAWTDDVLFSSRIEAWPDGPVAPDLFRRHQGRFRVSSVRGGNAANLTEDEKDTIDRVLAFYGDKSPQWLIDLTHQEDPWMHARDDLPARMGSTREITPESMGRYYASL